jgi:hypothetical protein
MLCSEISKQASCLTHQHSLATHRLKRDPVGQRGQQTACSEANILIADPAKSPSHMVQGLKGPYPGRDFSPRLGRLWVLMRLQGLDGRSIPDPSKFCWVSWNGLSCSCCGGRTPSWQQCSLITEAAYYCQPHGNQKRENLTTSTTVLAPAEAIHASNQR